MFASWPIVCLPNVRSYSKFSKNTYIITQQPTKIMGGLTRDLREGSREKGVNGECGGRRGGILRERRARGGG